ncbi:MAG: GxxExxY protein [Pedobacter sp.]|nr:GxxExxY protein [Pedobacter sp.]MDQ8054461.1 GxxExxY protein [Pedobacter sp.]
MFENEIAKIIVNAAYKIHRQLGPGLLESSYEACLIYELSNSGLTVASQVGLPLIYDTVHLNCGYRIDLLVEDMVIVEIKAVNELQNIHQAQLITYLKLSGCKLGLLINFNVPQIKSGIKRLINGYLEA